jgi:hypothetical protein
MKYVLLLIFTLTLAGCSEKSQEKNAMAPRKYFVSFAVAKIPDSMMKAHGCSTSETNFDFGSLDARYEFAAYVLSHTNEVSITPLTGNSIPTIYFNRELSFKFLPDAKQEDQDFQNYGYRLTGLDFYITGGKESDRGCVACDWSGSYSIKGNSNNQDGDGSFVGGKALMVDKPDLHRIYGKNGVSLCILVGLKSP